jgi:integrase
VDLHAYDRTPELTVAEAAELDLYTRIFEISKNVQTQHFQTKLQRLVRPLCDVMDVIAPRTDIRGETINAFLRESYHRGRSYWGWTNEEWLDTLMKHRRHRPVYMAVAYVLGGFTDLHAIQDRVFRQYDFAKKVFGEEAIGVAIRRVQSKLADWGYAEVMLEEFVPRSVCEALLANRSPRLEDLSRELLEIVRGRNIALNVHRCLVAVSEVLVSFGILEKSLAPTKIREPEYGPDILQGVPEEWAHHCEYWRRTSARGARTLTHGYYWLLHVGRWLGREHPEAASPAAWTPELAVECVAVIGRLKTGDWAGRTDQILPSRLGKPTAASTVAGRLGLVRAFFLDLQEWGTIPRRFDPRRYLRTPRSIRARLGPNPRVIADDIWAKLLWAGLNITEEDLPACHFANKRECRTCFYPLSMVRALVIVWLFAGLRRDEIHRLRVGCVRWQPDTMGAPAQSGGVCFLDVPVNKTAAPFTKPVDRVIGDAVAVWEKERPKQPKRLDVKTGESVDFLFLYRGKRLGLGYLNMRLIPALCRKAGIPTEDVRGNITSHRARSTIASQLFNAREPMSLFELQEWLGHRTPSSTQHYVKITPTKLARSYSDAGYFHRNLRTIEVLIDRDVVARGAAAQEPWKFYDLGHGYCTYEFFDHCPHRMACAKCDFYRPKSSTEAQLLEGKANLLRMQQTIPLEEAELAAVEDGVAAIERLLVQLADVPTPAGPTPRQLQASGLVEIRKASSSQA